MEGFTQKHATTILNDLFGRSSSSGDNAYGGLSLTEPAMDGSNITEPSSDLGYERVMLDDLMGTPTLSTDGTRTEITNVKEIHFNEATGTWGSCGWFCIYSSKTASIPDYVCKLTAAVSPVANTIAIIRTGDIKISLV